MTLLYQRQSKLGPSPDPKYHIIDASSDIDTAVVMPTFVVHLVVEFSTYWRTYDDRKPGRRIYHAEPDTDTV